MYIEDAIVPLKYIQIRDKIQLTMDISVFKIMLIAQNGLYMKWKNIFYIKLSRYKIHTPIMF